MCEKAFPSGHHLSSSTSTNSVSFKRLRLEKGNPMSAQRNEVPKFPGKLGPLVCTENSQKLPRDHEQREEEPLGITPLCYRCWL